MKIKILFLDDRTKRINSAITKFADCELTIVTNVSECLRYMASEDFNEIYLDHDLGGLDFVDPEDKNSGMEVIRYLHKTEWPDRKIRPRFIIHSSNVFAAELMRIALDSMYFFVECRPWKYD